MFQILKENLSKRKIHHFLYTHLLFLAGLLFLDVSSVGIAISVLSYLLIISPISVLITHLKFNHNYIEFKNSIMEWAGLVFMSVYSFWKFTDIKNYHILHHKAWKTSGDPTASEIQQGKLKYYIGLTHPCAIPHSEIEYHPKVGFINRYFYLIKLTIYALIVLVSGLEGLFYTVFAQQFYFYVGGKIHDMTFHTNNFAVDKPWLFPIYFNNAWHVEHHKKYDQLDPWHWKYINIHYWYYRLLFNKVGI